MDDNFFTISAPASIEIKEKGSRFIGETALAETIEAAQQALLAIRKREHGATHHCYAYSVRTANGLQFKYSDDGEPGGTAGRPIYDVVEGSGLVNLLCVVTRYYGGTKLGTGGLARAYSNAAKQAIEQSGRKEEFTMSSYLLEFAFPAYDQVNRLLLVSGAKTVESDFGEAVRLQIQIRESKAEALVEQLTELTAGQARITEVDRAE